MNMNIKDLYKIIKENLADIEVFLSSVKEVLSNPQKFGLEIE